MPKSKASEKNSEPVAPVSISWQKAQYHFHSYAYRDPRSVFASGAGSPVVSPTTVLLGIVSTLFSIGEDQSAKDFLSVVHQCQVMVDAPDGIIFFRAFHQLRRYETLKYGDNPRFGLTKINQGTREYGLVDGVFTLYVGVPESQVSNASLALTNLRHLGTSDSLCSLQSEVLPCDKSEANEVVYAPSTEYASMIQQQGASILNGGVTMVTLSRFKSESEIKPLLSHWHLSGGPDTEQITYVIPGMIRGTTRGKIYTKHRG